MNRAPASSADAQFRGGARLCPCPADDLTRLAGLRQLPGQFAADAAEMICDPTPELTFHEIRWDGRLAGCFKLDPLYHHRHAFASINSVGIRGVLIDRALQGQGIGTAAMLLLRGYIPQHYPDAGEAILTVNIANPAARNVYLRAGFVDNGAMYLGGERGPQHILRLML